MLHRHIGYFSLESLKMPPVLVETDITSDLHQAHDGLVYFYSNDTTHASDCAFINQQSRCLQLRLCVSSSDNACLPDNAADASEAHYQR